MIADNHYTLWGNIIGHTTNMMGFVDGVSNMDGLTAVGGITTGGKAFTIGPYSFGPKGYSATWKDHTFVHEYGHYIQHKYLGLFYIQTIAVPSLLSATASNLKINLTNHLNRWFEVDASRRGAEHFDKKYGSGKEGYMKASNDYFDLNSFQTGKPSPYLNPRTGEVNHIAYSTSNPTYVFWDYFIPSILSQWLPTLYIKNI